jgi:hypothetical protein
MSRRLPTSIALSVLLTLAVTAGALIALPHHRAKRAIEFQHFFSGIHLQAPAEDVLRTMQQFSPTTECRPGSAGSCVASVQIDNDFYSKVYLGSPTSLWASLEYSDGVVKGKYLRYRTVTRSGAIYAVIVDEHLERSGVENALPQFVWEVESGVPVRARISITPAEDATSARNLRIEGGCFWWPSGCHSSIELAPSLRPFAEAWLQNHGQGMRMR